MNETYRAEFLDLLSDIDKVEYEFKSELQSKFNIFIAAGLLNQEIRHSKILAFFLDPSESHRLGDYLLRKICGYASRDPRTAYDEKPDSLALAIGNFKDAKVSTEVNFSGDRIDVLIESKSNNLIVAIENKVMSSFSKKDQLKIYRDKINSEIKYKKYKKIFIYLTLDEEPDDKTWWTQLSHKFIYENLAEIVKVDPSSIPDDTGVFIRHYIDLLKRHIMNDNEELADVCREIYIKHKNILDLIFENAPNEINDAIDLFKNEHNDSITSYASSKRRFGFLPNELIRLVPEICEKVWWKQKRPLIFWFEFKEDRIVLFLEIGPITGKEKFRQDFVQNLRIALNQKNNRAISDLYTRILKYEAKYANESDSFDPQKILEKMNSLFSKNYMDIKDILIESLKNSTWPSEV